MMNISLSAQDVLDEIEFELIQGTISKDELGQGVAQAKEYQNKLRNELFQPGQNKLDWREVAARQFQLNDMLLLLLQEMAVTHQEWAAQARRRTHRQLLWQPLAQTGVAEVTAVPSADDLIWRDTTNIQDAMTETLEVTLEAQPSNVPLLGTLLRRLKYEMHNLVIFYVNKVAWRQTAVNHIYGDWLLYFDSLHQHQDHQFRVQLSKLENRMAALEDRETKNAPNSFRKD